MTIGRTLILAGIGLIVLGVLVSLGARFTSLGRLPGDVVIRRPNFTLYFPLATSLLLSLALTLIFWLFNRR